MVNRACLGIGMPEVVSEAAMREKVMKTVDAEAEMDAGVIGSAQEP